MSHPLGYKGDLTLAFGVADIDRAIAWYRDVLGFTLDYKVDDMGWCEMKSPVPGVTVGFSQVEKPEVKGGGTPVFGVADIDAARSYLESRDVRFDGPTSTIPGMVRLAVFYDPDGQKLMLAQSLGGAA